MKSKLLQELQAQITHTNASIIAVSKNVSIEKIIHTYQYGQRAFAENYAQELLTKVTQLRQYNLEWHFIGKLQTNKIKLIAPHVAWVHSVENIRQAELLNRYRTNLTPLNVLIEVNLGGIDTRGGVHDFNEIVQLANAITQQEHLKLRGLMGMATHTRDNELIRQQFTKLREYKDKLNTQGYNLDTLSMGMSNDYRIALECGATMLRLGSIIFGDSA